MVQKGNVYTRTPKVWDQFITSRYSILQLLLSRPAFFNVSKKVDELCKLNVYKSTPETSSVIFSKSWGEGANLEPIFPKQVNMTVKTEK